MYNDTIYTTAGFIIVAHFRGPNIPPRERMLCTYIEGEKKENEGGKKLKRKKRKEIGRWFFFYLRRSWRSPENVFWTEKCRGFHVVVAKVKIIYQVLFSERIWIYIYIYYIVYIYIVPAYIYIYWSAPADPSTGLWFMGRSRARRGYRTLYAGIIIY